MNGPVNICIASEVIRSPCPRRRFGKAVIVPWRPRKRRRAAGRPPRNELDYRLGKAALIIGGLRLNPVHDLAEIPFFRLLSRRILQPERQSCRDDQHRERPRGHRRSDRSDYEAGAATVTALAATVGQALVRTSPHKQTIHRNLQRAPSHRHGYRHEDAEEENERINAEDNQREDADKLPERLLCLQGVCQLGGSSS